MGCVMLERRGYRVSCPSTSEAVDVFDHGTGTVSCDGDYLVMVGIHTFVTEDLMGCTGVVDDRIEAVFLRLR
jgi:hypothetical protein